MKKTYSTLCTFFFTCLLLFAQSDETIYSGGRGIYNDNLQAKCLTDNQREAIQIQLDENIKQLKKTGVLKTNLDADIVSFSFPLQKDVALDFNNFYSVSNYVDQDLTSNILDYNCNARSYNGHQGTDFFTWPFPWYLYENDLVNVVAAAPGMIIFKQDNQYDQSCQFGNQTQWNAVYVRHSDGSVAWYGHLKANSLTSKSVGSTVAEGEYLGVVASSGYSTGPHLHFEIYDNAGNLIDPYQGTCNSLNNASWWQTQLPHTQTRINAALTHSAPPVPDCPLVNEVTNFKNNFIVGERVYVGAYYKDQIAGQTATLTLRRPDLSVWNTWNQTFQQNFVASWWWWFWNLPSNGPYGTWRFDITLNGETVFHPFEYLETNLPVELTNFKATLTNKDVVLLTWQTASETNSNGFEIQHAMDAATWYRIGFTESTGSANEYTYIHTNPQKGMNYYRLKQMDNNGDFEYSKIVNVKVNRNNNIYIYPNPVKEKISIIGIDNQDIGIKIYDSTGILTADFISNTSEIDIAHLPDGLYFISIQSEGFFTTQKIIKNH